MCGVMACAGAVHPPTLQRVIDGIRRRGPDSLGIAWARESRWKIERHLTPSWPEPFAVTVPSGSIGAIAHARLATSGKALADAQPLEVSGSLIFAHNGIVYRHEDLARKHGFTLTTNNDSEALALLFVHSGFDPGATMEMLADHQGHQAHAWVAALERRVWIASYGHPLYYVRAGDTTYAASWRIPGAAEIAGGPVMEWNI